MNQAAQDLLGWSVRELLGRERVPQALAEKRFVLHAQPIVDLRTGEVVQRELLLRMQVQDDAGVTAELIAPGVFLPVDFEVGAGENGFFQQADA